MFMLIPWYLGISAQDPSVSGALAARQSARTGRVEIHRVREMGGFTSTMDATCLFSETHYRLDIHQYEDMVPVVLPRGNVVDPLRTISDGSFAYECFVQPVKAGAAMTFAVRLEDQAQVPLFNARLLGLPAHPGPDVDVEAAFRPRHMVSKSGAESSIRSVELRDARDGDICKRLELKFDTQQGGSLVEYTMNIQTSDNIAFTVRGWSQNAVFDGVWFPTWVREQQFRGEILEWTVETYVTDCHLNCELDPATFTWSGIGARNRSLIASYVPGIASRRLAGSDPTNSPISSKSLNRSR